MGQYLIDNNVISSYLEGNFKESAIQFISEVIDQGPNLSVITEIEALSWINPDKSKEAILQAFIEEANILYITHDIVKECVRIRRNKKMKTPDALIAATAIIYNMILLTSDTDFNNIPTLQVVDPHSL
ncbi:MAG: type II toxin-antitoxin system VapC family toxin [Candidatus Amoebophilus sp.]